MNRTCSLIITVGTVLISALPISVSNGKDVRIGSWNVSEVKDAISDKPWVTSWTGYRDGGVWSTLAVICYDGKPAIRFFLPSYKFNRDDSFRFLLRIDDGDVTKGAGSAISDNEIWTGLTRQTYQKILAASKIAVRLVITDTGTRDFVYHVTKTPEAMRRVLAACPLSSASDIEPKKFKEGDHLESPTEMKELDAKEKRQQEIDKTNSPKTDEQK